MSDYCDEVGYKTIQVKTVKARKELTCDDCGKPIRKGMLYKRTAFLADGKFTVARTHNYWGYCMEDEK